MTDAELVCRGVQGDETALRTLFARYERQVMLSCVLSAHRDLERARDLAQEVWGRAFGALARIQPQSFGAFLVTVTRNVCRTRGTQEKRRQIVEVPVGLESFEPGDSYDDAHEKELREERIRIVQLVLARVRKAHVRTIVTLKYSEPGLTAEQIARHLRVPRGTVLVTLMRFRAAIRRELLSAMLDRDVWKE